MLFFSAHKVLAKILFWREIFRQRQQLSTMDDDQLKDLGISRVDADCEAHRMVWDYSPTVDETLQSRTSTALARSSKRDSTKLKLRLH